MVLKQMSLFYLCILEIYNLGDEVFTFLCVKEKESERIK